VSMGAPTWPPIPPGGSARPGAAVARLDHAGGFESPGGRDRGPPSSVARRVPASRVVTITPTVAFAAGSPWRAVAVRLDQLGGGAGTVLVHGLRFPDTLGHRLSVFPHDPGHHMAEGVSWIHA